MNNIPTKRFPEFRDEPEWEEKNLQKIANFVNKKISFSNLDAHQYISTENILQDFAGFKKTDTLPPTGSATEFHVGDILVSNIRPYLKKIWVADFEGGASNDVLVIRASENINQKFLSFNLKNDTFIDYVMSGAKGVKMPRGDVALIKQYPLYVPHKQNEQQKIADCLSSIDDLINLQTTKVETLQAHKKGLMQNLFPKEGENLPKFRFPEFKNEPEWKEKEVGEIFQVTRGYVLSMNLVTDNQTKENIFPVYSSQTKNNGLAGYYSEYLYEDAITWTTDGANAGDVNYRKDKFYCTNVCGVLLNNDGYANLCIAELINSVSKKHVSYVGNPKLMNGVMNKISIKIPSLKEQQKIANFLNSIDEQINLESQKVKALKEHKKGLMQQLFPSKLIK